MVQKKLKISVISSTFFFIFILIFGTLFILGDSVTKNVYNTTILFSFILNGIIIFTNLLKTSISVYRLRDVFYVFMYIFMFIAPFIQYSKGRFPWEFSYLINENTILLANVLITLFLILFEVSYNITWDEEKVNKEIKKMKKIRHIPIVINAFYIMSVICGGFIIVNTGFLNLFSRSTSELNLSNSTFEMVIYYTFRSIPVFFVTFNILYFQKRGRIFSKTKLFVGLVIMLLVNFPTGTSRAWMAIIYIGLISIVLKRPKNPHIIKILILFGMLVVFPIINVFRHLSFEEVLNSEIELPSLSDSFTSGDFDSFSMFARALNHVEIVGISYGRQLLGSILFFIPRDIWPNKPIGSGATVGRYQGWNFTNVSMPIIGEGYVNFGIFGIFFFSILLGVILKRMDISYANSKKTMNSEFKIIEFIFPYTIGFLFLILRGDLLSSLSVYVGFMAPILVLYMMNRYQK